MRIRSYWHTLTGEDVIAFLKQILRVVRGYIILVWDRHPIHKRKIVQEFIQSHKRLIVFEFPVAAPELNPAEFVWAQTKEYIAGTAPHNKCEMQSNVYTGIARTRSSQKRLFACLLGSRLDWID